MERITAWQHELAANGARAGEHGVITDFGDPAGEARAARESAVVVPLTESGLITASGADTAEFLNSQFTSDVAAVSPQHAQYTGYCNPKGRLLATMLLFRDGDTFCMALPAELATPVAQRLHKYVLRAKVKIAVATADYALFGVTGPEAATALTASLASPPAQSFATTRTDERIVITLPGERFLVVCQANQASAAWASLSRKMRPAGSNWWQLQTIRAGVATVTSATEEAFVPQMLALDAYGAVSFQKGCYPGQEIVARMHYLGDLKRLLYYGRSGEKIVAGDQVVDAADDKTAGTVVNAAANEDGGYDFLAVLQRDTVKAGSTASDTQLRTRGGHELNVVSAVSDMLARSGK